MKFLLRKSESAPGWWTLAIPEYGLSIRFEEHKFNETQEVVFTDQTLVEDLGAQGVARIMREAGDWLAAHAYSVAMPTPVFEFREIEDSGSVCLLRNKFPRFTMNIEDECDEKQLADALRAASEFLRKRSRNG